MSCPHNLHLSKITNILDVHSKNQNIILINLNTDTTKLLINIINIQHLISIKNIPFLLIKCMYFSGQPSVYMAKKWQYTLKFNYN